jgi:hypothetical protein
VGPRKAAAGTRSRAPRNAPAAERDPHDHRREQDDDRQPQVLHERDEAIIGAEVVRHRHDPGRAPGDHAERGGRPVHRRDPREQHARADRDRERRRAHEHDRDPARAEACQRRGVQVGADHDAGYGLPRGE